MAARILGFDPKIIKKAEFEKKFTEACVKLAERVGADVSEYDTKRQRSKFKRGEGIVFQEMSNTK